MPRSNTYKQKIDEAFTRLVSLFESGELRASANMALFLHEVCDEIIRLRENVGRTNP